MLAGSSVERNAQQHVGLRSVSNYLGAPGRCWALQQVLCSPSALMSLVWTPAPGRTRWKKPLAFRPVYCITRLPFALRSSASQVRQARVHGRACGGGLQEAA